MRRICSFDEAPKALLEKVEQVVRLIRSKGVGVFFVTQNPLDVPDSVSSQLGNRVQHALRAFTPREQRVVKAAAETFRPNPDFKTVDVIKELGIGEALTSTLLSKGAPGVVQRTLIRPPESRMGPITKKERSALLAASEMGGKYDDPRDRESAYEILQERAERLAKREAKEREREEKSKTRKRSTTRRRRSNRQSVGEAAFKTAARTLARELVRGVLGSLKRR